MKNSFEAEMRARKFDGSRSAKLGTKQNPAVISVQSEERKKEVAAIFAEHKWNCEIEVNPDNPENIKDLDTLLHPVQPVKSANKVGRNDPCPCGSGKKNKKCCGSV